MFNENRSGEDLQNSLNCTGQTGVVSVAANCSDENGICDNGVLCVTEADGKVHKFFKSVLNICIKGVEDCNQINDGRGANTDKPYVLLKGVVADCDGGAVKYSSVVLYPVEGQTLVQLKTVLLALCDRNCA